LGPGDGEVLIEVNRPQARLLAYVLVELRLDVFGGFGSQFGVRPGFVGRLTDKDIAILVQLLHPPLTTVLVGGLAGKLLLTNLMFEVVVEAFETLFFRQLQLPLRYIR